ncbi:CtsR family transcriptional regulator [Christensenellaceae bacterium OttesenSCG-928-K19]|nr:CtsR family transcriptional regulator [Christensenellaceae bacterium OttesenSCG-928-K19]
MSVLSDHIETFIKEMLAEEDGTTDLQRNELAQKFNCAPSQINYVLTTRFSPSRGYIIQSRRGGGGYIRVIRLDLDRSDYITELIESELVGGINLRQANELIEGLYQIGFIDAKTRVIMRAAISDRALPIVEGLRNELRATILKEMLVQII